MSGSTGAGDNLTWSHSSRFTRFHRRIRVSPAEHWMIELFLRGPLGHSLAASPYLCPAGVFAAILGVKAPP